MTSRIGNIKSYVEIFAIVIAGLFTFFTWGINYIDLLKPNWDLFLTDVSQYSAIEVNGINMLCPPDSKDCKDNSTACIYGGTLKIMNKGKSLITPGNTEVDVYLLNRFRTESFIDNDSPYQYLLKTCETNTAKKDCYKANYSFTIKGIDSSPIYPGTESWRPFTIEINPQKLDSTQLLVDFAKEHVLLIVIKQSIKSRNLLGETSEIRRFLHLTHSVCYKRDLITKK